MLKLRLHANAINNHVTSRNKYRHGRCVSDNCVNKANKFIAYFCNKQANVLIRNQSPIVIMFPNGPIRFLECMGKIDTMQSVYFIKQTT